MISIVNKIISKLEFYLSSNWLNLPLTLWVNFIHLPFKSAIKIPIFVYGNPNIKLNGKIMLTGGGKTGGITFNKVEGGCPSITSIQTTFFCDGRLVLADNVRIGTGNTILISKNKTLQMGNYSRITDCCFINIQHHNLYVGNQSWIVHNCRIDTKDGDIRIGNNCWICNTCCIEQGITLPNGTIVASHTFVNIHQTIDSTNSLIGGYPARVIRTGVLRVDNKLVSDAVNQYFKKHFSDEEYNYDSFYKKTDLIKI